MGVKQQGIESSSYRYQVIPRTLLFITNKTDVLLLKGAPDKKIWPGLYNGVGGHIEIGETVLEAAYRELYEETGLQKTNIKDFRLIGITHIDVGLEGRGILLFIFSGESVTREVIESVEGSLDWVQWIDLALDQMTKDLPQLLSMLNPRRQLPYFAKYWYDDADVLHTFFQVASQEEGYYDHFKP